MSDYQGNIIIKNPATPTGPAATGRAPGMWKLNEVAYWIKQGVWPNANIVPDIYFPYVSLLLSTTSLGNANNNLFVDSSGAFNPVSRSGNTTQGSFTPYSTNWSNYFDGSGDYERISSSQTALQFGTGDFTVEGWAYSTGATGTYQQILTGGSSWTSGSGGVYWYYNGGSPYIGAAWNQIATNPAVNSGTLAINTWHHFAVVRSGNTLILYVNGTSVDTLDVTGVSLAVNNQSQTNIGGGGWDQDFGGYLSNLRVVKGTAVYTANFTPPTSPLTAITNTSLLTCQSNRFRDASTNNFTITVAGNTSVTDFSPFNPTYPGAVYNQSDITNWSGYFDGSGDYLSVPDNAALNMAGSTFTLECWIYPNGNYSDYRTIMSKRNASTTSYQMFLFQTTGYLSFSRANTAYQSSATPTANAWNHVAAVYDGTNINLYLNGTRVLQTAVSIADTADPLLIGAIYTGGENFNGYISNARVLKGVQAYSGATITVPTTPLTAISGTSLLTLQNAAFTDNSTNNFVITPNGNVTVTGNSPFNTVGYWSNYFTSSAYLSVPVTSSAFTLNADFTLEAWVYREPSGLTTLFDTRSGGNYTDWVVGVNGSGQVDFVTAGGAGVRITTTETVTANTWTHVACVRQGSTIKIYLNGVASVNTATYASTITPASTEGWIGRTKDPLNNAGYISNLRLVKGTAVYTANFTPPTAPLTAISGTSLLTCQNGRFIDNSTNAFTITPNNSPQVQSFDPFYTATIASNGGSMYFDGNADLLSIPNGPSMVLSGGVYTLEAWVYPTGDRSAYRTIFVKRAGDPTPCAWQVSLSVSTGNLIFYNGTLYNSGVAAPLNAWSHVAAVYDGTNINLYLNGSRVLQSATSNVDCNANVQIGYFFSSVQEPFIGYIANARILKGVQAYTGTSYTVPTAPANPTAATVLMVNGMNAGAYDATTINDMETVGNAQVRYPSPFAPADYWAGAFDGSGDYLTAPSNSAFEIGTGQFTLECWIYFNTVTNINEFLWADNSGTTGGRLVMYYSGGSLQIVAAGGAGGTSASWTPVAGQWYHLAASRDASNNQRLFVNGVLLATATSTNNYTQNGFAIARAASLNGYMSNVRLVKGTAVYTANFTPSTTPLTAISGTSLLTCQNKTFIDNSSNAFTITAFGNATAGAIGPFTATGGTSVYFGGLNNWLDFPANPTADFGTGDITIECWLYVTSTATSYQSICQFGNAAVTSGFHILTNNNTICLRTNNSQPLTTSGTFTANTWNHIALTRASGTTRIFINGTTSGGTYNWTASLSSGSTRRIGGDIYSNALTGYIDDFRVTRGVARYTSNFTPPTQAFPTY